jgi:glycosyltransferase involved in cell wall biosynthesis
MSSSPRVSVLMPACNAARWLPAALDSALAQTFTDFEVLLVDDGSTDATGAVADAYAARDPRVRVIHQANAGLPAARNVAIAAARGDLLALLDADDEWLPEHLAQAVAALDADPALGLVHADIQRIDAAGQPLARHGPPRWRGVADPFAALALRREHVSCPTAVFRRRCIDVVGAFDLQFTGLGCEDRDLWLRIVERFPVRYLDRVTARYRMHAGSMSSQRGRMAAARQRLLDKLRCSARGAPLARHIAAMIDHDLAWELQQEGRYGAALCTQLRALARRPHTPLLWRRLLGLLRALAGRSTPATAIGRRA